MFSCVFCVGLFLLSARFVLFCVFFVFFILSVNPFCVILCFFVFFCVFYSFCQAFFFLSRFCPDLGGSVKVLSGFCVFCPGVCRETFFLLHKSFGMNFREVFCDRTRPAEQRGPAWANAVEGQVAALVARADKTVGHLAKLKSLRIPRLCMCL